jgi:hypothetical protein
MGKDKKSDILQALRSIKGSDVLAQLGTIAPLPKEGVVAGQAVASLLMSKMGLGFGAPINDVDVFLSVDTARGAELNAQTEEMASKKRRLASTASRATQVQVYMGGSTYSGMAEATMKAGYLILGTAREGMLNEVAYERLRGAPHAARTVLLGFDLNCVQAGVDASSGELVWTPAFEDFVTSGQLRVANVNTPFHTAARYFKKKAELGCFGDDELNMAMCALPWARGVFGGRAPGVSSLACVAGRYGAKVHAQCEQLGPELSAWFKEVKALDHANIWTMEPVFEGREDVLRRLVEAASPLSSQEVWKGPVDSFLFAHAQEFCSALLRPMSRAESERRARTKATMLSAGSSRAAARWVEVLALGRGKEYARGADVSSEAARALAGLLSQHQGLSGPLSEMSLPDQAALATELREEERQHGQRVYGWLESHARVGAAPEGEPTLEALLADKAARVEFYGRQRMDGERVLAPPLDLPQMGSLALRVSKSLLKVQFAELSTLNELEAEGRAMSHCVGGYAGAVERGGRRIFKVEGAAKADRATLEVALEGARGVEVMQLRSHANRAPGAGAARAAEMLAAACGKARPDQVLGVAGALIGALDEGVVAATKLRSAQTLMRVALAEAKGRDDTRSAKLAERLEESLGKHFPGEPLDHKPARAPEPLAEQARGAIRRWFGRGG